MINKKGQVAVILILVAAAALIFYAISINFGRVSQTKTLTTIAANTGTSMLASYIASYGQQIFITQLDGWEKVTGPTGTWGAIVAVVVAIVAVIITVGSGGLGAGAAAALVTATWTAMASLVVAVGALVIQVTDIQPGFSAKWNNQMSRMSSEDAGLEQGMQTALTAIATDSVEVPDINDSDGDRVWGISNGQVLDSIGRFGFYYGEKRLNTVPLPITADIESFINALRNFVRDDGDGWGIYDDTGPVCDSLLDNSECNPCCVPKALRDNINLECDNDPLTDNDPDTEDLPNEDETVISTTCGNNSPYGGDYPYVYDAYRGNPTNSFVSFNEALGRDDEHRGFEKSPLTPNGLQSPAGPPPPPPNPSDIFQLSDTTGYHGTDIRKGIYPFFYKIADWGVSLDPALLTTNDAYNPQCHWCDHRASGVATCEGAAQPAEIPQLFLTVWPPAVKLQYNTTPCVDGTNLVPGNPPLVPDFVKLPTAATGVILANGNQCAQNAYGNPNMGFWKKGGDRFCSDTSPVAFPYAGTCAQKFGMSCATDDTASCPVCGQIPPAGLEETWPDDVLDDLVYGLNGFISWAEDTIETGPDAINLSFKTWYQGAARWIEPGSASVADGGNAATNFLLTCNNNCTYTNTEQDGILWVWYKKIQDMLARLQNWRNTSFASDEAWCVPASGNFGAPPDEVTTFDSNGNGVRGDMEDVVACLNWNVNDRVTYPNAATSSDPLTTEAIGNAAKFKACFDECNAGGLGAAEKCSDLPRSLKPGVDTSWPSSCNLAWVSNIEESIAEAENQVAKFNVRYNFLDGRLKELDNIISIFDTAQNEFGAFLSGPAQDLIKARIAFNFRRTGLPYHAIYGWQGESQDGTPGKWHIARVDVRMPGKCDNACYVNQNPLEGDPKWPWVHNEDDRSGTRFVYSLESTTGIVKTRVTRFDESRDSSPIMFPNGTDLWKPIFTRGDRAITVGGSIDDLIRTRCNIPSIVAADPPGLPVGFSNIYGGAFLLNERDINNENCWDLANELLASGVTSEACAQYYFHKQKNRHREGMDFKFVPCKDF